MRKACLVLVMFATPGAFAAVEAQGLGGLIKKKVKEATSPSDAAAKTDNAQSSGPYVFESVYVLDSDLMAGFKRALELEVKVRTDFRQRLASLKTPDQYRMCETEVAMTPEAQKVLEGMTARMEKVTNQEEMAKVSEWAAEQLNPIILKRCGQDPTPVIHSQREVFERAEISAAIEFAQAWKRATPPPEPDEVREALTAAEPMIAACDSRVDAESDDAARAGLDPASACTSILAHRVRVALARSPEPADTVKDADKLSEYQVLKERLEKFCSLPKEQQEEAARSGIKVPGDGKDIYWVFPRGFAIWVGPDCDHLMKLYRNLQ